MLKGSAKNKADFMEEEDVGGVRIEGWAGNQMNMYVHIYPENDYLLEHSLIVFHNSFCAYSPFY